MYTPFIFNTADTQAIKVETIQSVARLEVDDSLGKQSWSIWINCRNMGGAYDFETGMTEEESKATFHNVLAEIAEIVEGY